MQQCWKYEASERISFKEILEQLTHLQDEQPIINKPISFQDDVNYDTISNQ